MTDQEHRRPQPIVALLFRCNRMLRKERFEHRVTRGELAAAVALAAHRTAERDDARAEAKRAKANLDFLVSGRLAARGGIDG